tara:strand:- start:81 stop:1184 length:1104 start_codon:yes stop_codon:yes gene_type:complete
MATYQNPFLYGFSPWPFEEEDLTTTGTTAGGITDAYIGGGGDGDAGGAIPILPRPREIEDYDWLNKIPAGDPGAGGVGGQLRKWGPTTSAFDIPNFSEIANTMLGREGATEAFAGGAGNVGSRAGLYPDEVANLNTVMQGGYLNANNTGQDIFGVNIVSAGGDYAKRQQEIKDYYDSKSEEELEILMRSKYQRGRRNNANNVVNANSAIVAAEKAATGFITKKDEREEEIPLDIEKAAASEMLPDDLGAVRQMPTVPAGGIEGGVWWPGQPTTGDPLENIPIEYASYDLTEEKQRKEEAARPPIQYDETSWSVDSGSSEPPSDDGGYQGTGSEAAQDNYGGGWDDGYWAKGGLIRKKYGNGGIVDLL